MGSHKHTEIAPLLRHGERGDMIAVERSGISAVERLLIGEVDTVVAEAGGSIAK